MITPEELKIMGHSLGVNVYHAKVSKKKKDKKLPQEFYRNYFCASPGHSDYTTLQSLFKKGYMETWTSFGNQQYFGVTDEGIKVFKEEFEKQVILNNQGV
jgi:DNA-binding PadR family transcriptional regulator